MEEYYAECRKPHQKLEWNFDGCQEFIPSGRHGRGLTTCRICDCHQSHHRRVVPKVKKVVVEYSTVVVYTRCHKIHHLHNSVDGCQEFLLSTTDMEELSCATCGCHKSFHRNEITTTTTTTTTTSLA